MCGRSAAATRAMADRFHVPDVHTDYRELCARTDIDAVTIVTPDIFHREQALFAFAHGKHVLCEKPLGMNVAEARDMLAAAEASGRVHQVGFIFRYNVGIAELRRRIAAGDDRPAVLPAHPIRQLGGTPARLAGHVARAARTGGGRGAVQHRLAISSTSRATCSARSSRRPGSSSTCRASASTGKTGEPTMVETDDFANCWFRFANGVRGQWCVSRVTPPFAEYGYVEVIGTEGALKAALSRGRIDVLKSSRPAEPAWQELPLPPEAKDDTQHALTGLMHGFVEACRRGRIDADLDASFHDGLAAQQGMAAVVAANALRMGTRSTGSSRTQPQPRAYNDPCSTPRPARSAKRRAASSSTSTVSRSDRSAETRTIRSAADTSVPRPPRWPISTTIPIASGRP